MSRPTNDEYLTPKEDYVDAWYAAQNSQCGIALRAFPRDAVYARLMQIRKQLDDPSLFELEIVKPKRQENELWIIKKRS